MVFNATFNNISVILWRSVLLVVETGVPGENHQPAASHWQTLSHNVLSQYQRRHNHRYHWALKNEKQVPVWNVLSPQTKV